MANRSHSPGRSTAEGRPLLFSLAGTLLSMGVIAVVRKIRRDKAARKQAQQNSAQQD